MNDKNELIGLTAEIVSAHVANNTVAVADMPNLIGGVYSALAALGQPAEEPEVKPVPAVDPRRSVKDDHIVCLEDGKRLKMLKRHIMTRYGLTPDDYRRKWGLNADYPMVAPAYARQRADLAKRIGLGTGTHRRGGAPLRAVGNGGR